MSKTIESLTYLIEASMELPDATAVYIAPTKDRAREVCDIAWGMLLDDGYCVECKRSDQIVLRNGCVIRFLSPDEMKHKAEKVRTVVIYDG